MLLYVKAYTESWFTISTKKPVPWSFPTQKTNINFLWFLYALIFLLGVGFFSFGLGFLFWVFLGVFFIEKENSL